MDKGKTIYTSTGSVNEWLDEIYKEYVMKSIEAEIELYKEISSRPNDKEKCNGTR